MATTTRDVAVIDALEDVCEAVARYANARRRDMSIP